MTTDADRDRSERCAAHSGVAMNLVETKRRKLIALICALPLALGAEAAEPVARPTLIFTIDVKWPNATAFRIEREMTSKIQRAVKTLPDLIESQATASVGRGQVRLSFDPKVDAAATAAAIRNRIDQIKTSLPHGAAPPLVSWRRDAGKSL